MTLIKSDAELYSLVCDGLKLSAEDTRTIEELGNTLPSHVQPEGLFASPPRYWQNLKEEFRLLVCTNDSKYASLRRQLRTKGNKSQAVIVSIISAAMAHTVGVAAGILVPFCALCLLAFARVGKEAFCKTASFDVPAHQGTCVPLPHRQSVQRPLGRKEAAGNGCRKR